jgi:uncharacterized repeat protein (TIGR03803 family)
MCSPCDVCLRIFNWKNRAYGLLLMCLTTAIAAQSQTFASLHSFDGTDGANPYGELVQATDGNFYGTTAEGGANGQGTVFKITPNGTLTTLYNFCSKSNCTDGALPYSGLVQATNGNFYGTTIEGGASGSGTVFRITQSGTLTTLHSFCSESGCTDGGNPYAALVQATDGNFYGTTFVDGANNAGTVFRITPSGALTTIYTFCSQSCADGGNTYAGLIQAANGDFYGTTIDGGTFGFGTLFKITPSGTLTALYSFCSVEPGCTDGAMPYGALVQGADGNFYGTTALNGGGANGPDGTVFKMTPSGTLTTLHSFCSQSDCTDGASPYAGLVQATNGNFFGTTFGGGANGIGTAFEITPSGVLTTLHSFDSTDGAGPFEDLAQGTDGSLYGATVAGGTNNDGTIFSVAVGLGPFVETQTSSGKVGSAVKILGTNLTESSAVMFNGTAALFKVASSSLINAIVPAGATTGFVTVMTSSGTLKSNKKFSVTP